MTDVQHSRSDLEALSRSGRGKNVVLGLLLVAAVLGAAWSFLRPQGKGNAEELTKVMVVSPIAGRSVELADLGFDAVEGSLAAWVRKAEDEVPDLEVTGVAAVMEVADRFGYAWVVFERPQDIDFSELDIEGGVPELPEHVQFVALSAGELAFPHKLTVNPQPSRVVRGAGISLLQTLFAQEQLAQTLPANEAPSMEVIKLRDRLADAIDRVERVPEAERMADKIVGEVETLLTEDERAKPLPATVGERLEVNTPVPLANGKLLSIAQGFALVSRDAVRADLDLEDTERFVVGDPGAAAESRVPCDALAGGAMSVAESAKYWYADDGSAILVKSLSQGLRLFTIAADAQGCGFVDAGTVPPGEPGMGTEAPMPQGASGLVARAGYVAGQGVVSVVRAGATERTLLGMVDGVELSDPRWIGSRYIVTRATPQGLSTGGLVFLDVEQPMLALALPATVFGGATSVDELAVGGSPERPTVTVVAGDDVARLHALTLPSTLAQLFAAPPVDAELEATSPELLRNEREGLPTVVLLDTNAFTATVVAETGSPGSLVVSPDGTLVAFTVRGEGVDESEPGDAEIAIAPIKPAVQGGALTLVTLNALKDSGPRFCADGKHLVFRTRFDVPRTKWVITAGRIADVSGAY